MRRSFPWADLPAWCLVMWLAGLAGSLPAEDGPIRKLTLDENAPVVPLFEGLERGILAARVVVKDEFGGHVLLTNTTDRPQTVALPLAVAAVQVLKQFQPVQGVGVPGPAGQTSQLGGGQAIGGPTTGIGPQGFPLGLQHQFPGNNFFSIPPERTVQWEFRTVCLEHGKPAPAPAKHYVLRPIELQTSSRVLQQLLADYDPAHDDRLAVQAAAWHLADGLSWDELGEKRTRRLGGLPPQAYFTPRQIQQARRLVETARKKAEAAPQPVSSAEQEKR